MKKTTQFILSTILLLSATACGVIPSGYRGQFHDPATGASLQLKGTKGTFTDGQGRQVQAKASDLKFENLEKGEPGIYVSTGTASGDRLEVFWISPDLSTRQQAAGITWFTSEVIYTLLDAKQKDKVQTIEFFRCVNGSVMLDASTKHWEIGCPADPEHFNLRRVK